MADKKSNQTPVQTGPAVNFSTLKRQLSRATFLGLEHTAYMALVVIVPTLIALGLIAAIDMWSSTQTTLDSALGFGGFLDSSLQFLTAIWALGIATALLVLTPLLIVLERRTRLEWQRRPGFSGRLAYKLPVYGALGVLAVLVTLAAICMLTVVVKSLVFIGADGVDIGAMYRDEFIPAVIFLIAFKAASWYVILLAMGRDYGKTFSSGVTALAAVTILTLLITSATVVHSTPRAQPLQPQNDTLNPFESPGQDSTTPELEELFRYQ